MMAEALATSLPSTLQLRCPSHLRQTPTCRPKTFLSLPSFPPTSPCLNVCSQRRDLWVPTTRKELPLRVSPIRASAGSDPTPKSSEKWLLEPVGDGDSRHIGYKVPLPGAFEIVSDDVTVGRLPEKASLVIPVATVSGLHARLEKKEGSLLVTDLNSTNGTYIGERRLSPGVVNSVEPGSLIIFGDTNLAMFRVSKLDEDVAIKATEAEGAPVESRE